MQRAWWKEAVVYQVYPRSFCDSDGDGMGDLGGIRAKLDYLEELGVDVIWLSPVYQSPGKDNGYDISDYRDILPEFGTLADWDALLSDVHARGMRLIMDLVVNHTSDQHPWFLESRKSKENPYRDYYIWRDGKGGEEPNNWESIFSGSVWQYDEPTGQYYMHLFTREQPDLNWENPKVRREIKDIARFWLDRGIDGFRIDTANLYAKQPGLPDAPVTKAGKYQDAFKLHSNLPANHEWLRELHDEVFAPAGCMTVGETSGVTPQDGRDYTDPKRRELNMIIQFGHMTIDVGKNKWEKAEYRPFALKKVLTAWQEGLNGIGWNCNYLSNHDQPRQVSRFGNDTRYRYESATMLATLIHTLQGTPFIYQGEELGMTNARFDRFEDFQDVEIHNWIAAERQKPDFNPVAALAQINRIGRDNARTPMQWDDSENAGFTSGTPWLRVNPNYPKINAKEQLANPHSVFQYYKKLIQLRKQHDVFVYGTFQDLLPDDPAIYSYVRTLESDQLFVLLNLTGEDLRLDAKPPAGKILLSNYTGRPVWESGVLLPYEAQVILC
ncbi:alpha-glucosidase [Anaerotruncus rubiinfantis]|uniref:alpha-glucosidase n=1 Tax=Anaerotruncus rubiinfantis TaxID=1720200 RepID=UPI0034A2D684